MKQSLSSRPLLWSSVLIAVLFVISALTTCGEKPSASKAPTASEQRSASTPTANKSTLSNTSTIRAEGRVVAYPGAEVVVAADTSGILKTVVVTEKDHIDRGGMLAELDGSEKSAALAEAKAQVLEAQANLRYLKKEAERASQLIKSKTIAQDSFEKVERDLDAARAQLEVAHASVKRLEAVLEKTKITAPIDATVVERLVQPGESVQPHMPLFRLVDLKRLRIEGEVDEYDAARVSIGSSVELSAEGFDNQVWKGVVEEIPDVMVRRSLHPLDPGKPSDTRVLLVKIKLLDPTPLRLGQRVEIDILPGKAGLEVAR